MSWPTCPGCTMPDVAVQDRAVEETAIVSAACSSQPGCALAAVAARHEVSVHRSYACASCGERFWTTELVTTRDARTVTLRGAKF